MPDQKLVGQNYTPPDLIAKVTGRAKYAEDYRADGMLFAKLLLSPMPHCRVTSVDARAALAMPGVKAILRADDLPDLRGAERALTNEPFYQGEPILAIAAVDEATATEAIEHITLDLEPLPFVVDPAHAAVRHRAEQQLAEQHAVGAIVLGVLRAAGHLGDQIGRRVVLTQQFVVSHGRPLLLARFHIDVARRL